MKILTYRATGGKAQTDLQFAEVKFDRLNLVVGNSASGKTRLLNTIFNSALLVTKRDQFYVGSWEMVAEHQGHLYKWYIETAGGSEGEEGYIVKESVIKIDDDGNENVLVKREGENIVALDKEMPRINTREPSISLLKTEKFIKPLYDGLQSIMRRLFSGPELDFTSGYEMIPGKLEKKINKNKDIDLVFRENLNISGKLYLLKKYWEPLYDLAIQEFMNTFPFVVQCNILDAEKYGFNSVGIVPVFSIKEKHISKWIPLNQLSSGMKKVLLIITDILTMPKDGGIYLIDEYENSLGINAINFFPGVLFQNDNANQYIITSHHPYIIANVPVKNWIIIHRKGRDVTFKQGEELQEQFGKSKQQAFIQLINDPFYSDGVE